MVALLERHGLRRGANGLQIVMMCELPANAVLADAFLDHVDGFSIGSVDGFSIGSVDGFSIGSNDMTQLTPGLDRDSALVAERFDERDPAVLFMIKAAIEACRRRGKYVRICGPGPSDHPDLADWLLAQQIDTMSLNPDTVVSTWLRLGQAQPQPA